MTPMYIPALPCRTLAGACRGEPTDLLQHSLHAVSAPLAETSALFIFSAAKRMSLGRRIKRVLRMASLLTPLLPGVGLAAGDVERGAQIYRSCVACHALEPGLHLTGPSLGGVWNRPAGEAEGFGRYSDALRGAGFAWDAVALDAWLEDPWAMIEGTSMMVPGIEHAGDRADLIAFLEQAGRSGGAERLVADGTIPAAYLRGPAPQPIADAPDRARVTSIKHCGDGYTIETADGARSVHWEKNVRLKIDSTETGPPPGIGVILGAGMQGDRYSVIFSSVADLQNLVSESCEAR